MRVEGAPAPEADLTRALYEQYANQIFRYCLHQLGSREEAEDAVQSTFLNAFRGIKRGVVPELESAWLFKIAHNVCLSRRRTSWRRGRIESPTDFDVVEELTPAPSRRADELIGLQDVLEQMPETQRRAILLREWQGLSYREISEELELSQAAVETLIFRARRALASGLEQPPEAKRRVVRGADLGNILAGLKTLLLGGGAAAKVAATVAVVSAGTVVAAAPVQQHRAHSHPPKAFAPAHAAHGRPASAAHVTAVATPASTAPAAPPTHARRHARVANVHTHGLASHAPPSHAVAVEQPAPASTAAIEPAAPVEPVVPQPAPDTTPQDTPGDRGASEHGQGPAGQGAPGHEKKPVSQGQAKHESASQGQAAPETPSQPAGATTDSKSNGKSGHEQRAGSRWRGVVPQATPEATSAPVVPASSPALPVPPSPAQPAVAAQADAQTSWKRRGGERRSASAPGLGSDPRTPVVTSQSPDPVVLPLPARAGMPWSAPTVAEKESQGDH